MRERIGAEPVFWGKCEFWRIRQDLNLQPSAIIAAEHGIYAASKFLRHSDITTTARHHADQKARINVGLGKFLDTPISPQCNQIKLLPHEVNKEHIFERSRQLHCLEK